VGQTSDEIKRHIDHTRDELDLNLSEASQRVRDNLDRLKPRNIYARHRGAVLGTAIGGGALAALFLAARTIRRRRRAAG